jgi:sugar phosphate isomerase/epimerase
MITRRRFIKNSALTTAGVVISSSTLGGMNVVKGNPVRLGGPVDSNFTDPAGWIKAVKALKYSSAYCPVQPGAAPELVKSYRSEASRNNIIIAEVGVWNNMLDPAKAARDTAIIKNIECLRLADEIGAACCVNISGAKGEIWDGPYKGNYEKETFEEIVETVRYIIDQAKPVNTFYALEPMPYMLPDSPDSYLDLIKAIDRKQFAVHLDPVNMISDPRRYFNNAGFLRECFSKLGPYIKSVHAKDIEILPKLTMHLEERRPGTGSLDYRVFLEEMSKLKDIPFMMEHLGNFEDYKLAADFIRTTGASCGIRFAD